MYVVNLFSDNRVAIWADGRDCGTISLNEARTLVSRAIDRGDIVKSYWRDTVDRERLAIHPGIEPGERTA
jgi:hypothetical protein